MKRILSLIAIACISLQSVNPLAVHGATTAVRLEITAPTTTRVGEAIDITVRAVDKDSKTVTSYRGSVIFSTDSVGDTVPAPGKTVTFTADDNGEKKFSKGVIFKKSGKQKLSVYDVTDDLVGEATITVDAASGISTGTDQGVMIITPENDSKITGDMVMISGKTRKNSKVALKLNGQDAGTVIADDSGIFTKNLTGLTQENNIVTASLIDGTTTSATSPEIRFSRIVTSSATYGVTISPANTVEASSPITITVDATPGLAELSLDLDGTILTTRETTSGKYTIQTIAPQKPNTYKISITQKDGLGQSKTTDATTTLTTTEKLAAPATPVFKNVKTTTLGSKIIFEFGLDNPPASLSSFRIAYGKSADALSQQVNTWTLDRMMSKTASGSYTWYIDKIPSDTYTFKIFGKSADGTLISGIESEPIIATIGTDSCTIGNITDVSVETSATKSLISWGSLTGAVSYNLYKVSAAGDYTLFQNTKDTQYTLFLASGAVTYDNFVVKALCDSTTESKEYSKITKVQSGPGMIAIIVIISAIFGAILMRRRFI